MCLCGKCQRVIYTVTNTLGLCRECYMDILEVERLKLTKDISSKTT